jgi:hypothetical protein
MRRNHLKGRHGDRINAVLAAAGYNFSCSCAGSSSSIAVPDSVRDPLGYCRNNTVNSHALIRDRGQAGSTPFHLLLDRGGLRQPRTPAGARGRSHRADVQGR